MTRMRVLKIDIRVLIINIRVLMIDIRVLIKGIRVLIIDTSMLIMEIRVLHRKNGTHRPNMTSGTCSANTRLAARATSPGRQTDGMGWDGPIGGRRGVGGLPEASGAAARRPVPYLARG
jgi:hypothetical protein